MYPSNDPTDLWPLILWGIIGASLIAFFIFNTISLIKNLRDGPIDFKEKIRSRNRKWWLGYFFWCFGLCAITFSFLRYALSIWYLFILMAVLGLVLMLDGNYIMKKSKMQVIK